jgi:predicted GIY-YIG superfamily endonuclease
MEKTWKVYIIYNKNYSYVGATNNIKRRIRMHNQEIKGGAKYTTSKGNGWKYICYVTGFKNKIDALQFEWALKHVKPRNLTGIYGRLFKLEKLLEKEKWTSNSVLSEGYKLEVVWCSPEYILEDFKTPEYVSMRVDDLY